ncbi:hypothetical protein B1A_14872, partial [mine drainage metagenome]
RQRERIRLFEHGARFECRDGATHEIDTLAGLACGLRWPEQWGVSTAMREPADFFDVKGDPAGAVRRAFAAGLLALRAADPSMPASGDAVRG